MKRTVARLPATVAAVRALGDAIAIARVELKWSRAALAERIGVGEHTVTRMESGDPGTAIGTYFEAAVVVGVPLFDTTADELGRVAGSLSRERALLPRRAVAPQPPVIDDDF